MQLIGLVLGLAIALNLDRRLHIIEAMDACIDKTVYLITELPSKVLVSDLTTITLLSLGLSLLARFTRTGMRPGRRRRRCAMVIRLRPRCCLRRGLNKRYESGPASTGGVTDVSFSVASGETVAIVGAGSNKGTLLHLLGGLDQPPGTVRYSVNPWRRCRTPPAATCVIAALGFVYQFHHDARRADRSAERRAGPGHPSRTGGRGGTKARFARDRRSLAIACSTCPSIRAFRW